MIKQPRPRQEAGLNEIRKAISEGHKNILFAAPCGFGKTVISAFIVKMAEGKGKRSLFACDRIKLVGQTIEEFDEMGIDFGVCQGVNPRFKIGANSQIASMQTLKSWHTKSKKRAEVSRDFINEVQLDYELSKFDIVIIDECHTMYAHIDQLRSDNPSAIFIGMSATPYTKGLGAFYTKLIVPATTEQLIDEGMLTSIRYFGGKHIERKGLGSGKIGGVNEYSQKLVAAATEAKTELAGDIVRNWQNNAQGHATFAFSPSIAASKFLVSEFNNAGIPAIHVDSYTTIDERDDVYSAFENGEFKILSCSQLLGVGIDMPFVKCLIDCYPVKSLITYIQRGGRIIRNFPGVDYGIYLDHAGNWSHFGGGIEEFYPVDLDDGTKKLDEKKLCKKDKKEAKEKECPMCYTPFFGMKCACGYEIDNKKAYEEGKELMQTDGSDLVELKSTKKKKLTAAEKRNKEATKADKQQFYSELLGYRLARESEGKKIKLGHMQYVYRDYFGVWPRGLDLIPTSPTVSTVKFMQHRNIKQARSGG